MYTACSTKINLFVFISLQGPHCYARSCEPFAFFFAPLQLRLMQNELVVEDVVKDRSIKVRLYVLYMYTCMRYL